MNGPSAAPSSSTGGTHNELCLSGWHVMSYTHAFLGYADFVVRSGYVPPSPFSHHGPGSSPATGKKCCATYSDSPCLSTVAVSLSPVGRVAPWGATRLEWCPHSAPFPPAGCCPADLSAVPCGASLCAPPRPPSVNVRGAALRARFDSARLGASRVLRRTEFI